MIYKKISLMAFGVVLLLTVGMQADPFFDFGFSFTKPRRGVSFDFGIGRPMTETKTYVVQPTLPLATSIVYCNSCHTQCCDDGWCPHCLEHISERVAAEACEYRKAKKRQQAQNELTDLKNRQRRIQRKISELQDEMDRLEDELERTKSKIKKFESKAD